MTKHEQAARKAEGADPGWITIIVLALMLLGNLFVCLELREIARVAKEQIR